MLGIFACMVTGSIQPIFGYIYGEQVYVLSQDYNLYGLEYKQVEVPAFLLRNCLYVVAIAVGLFLFNFLRFYAFGVVQMRMTLKMRKRVYGSILSKHIAFFDEDEHSTEKLCEVLEDDVELLNGASFEMIGPILEGLCGVAVAIGISLTEERDFFVYCIPAYPVLILSSLMMWKYQKGLIVHSEKYVEEADDFSTEMICNYQTA